MEFFLAFYDAPVGSAHRVSALLPPAHCPLTNEKSAKILRAAPTGALIHVLLVGSTHQAFCAPILRMESGYFIYKNIFILQTYIFKM